MSLVSIIIPVYNAEKYIRRCLDSILGQAFQDFEIIIVNDGSIDKSLEICLEYQSSKVKIVSQKNGGPSSARNRGILEASGEYIRFVDADDYILENSTQLMVEKMEENDSDILMAGIRCIAVGKGAERQKNICMPKKKMNKEQFWKEVSLYFTDWFIHYTPNKLYKTQILRDKNILFDETICNSEDLLFNVQYCAEREKFVVIEDIVYAYEKSNDMSISSVFREDAFLIQDYAYAEVRKIIQKQGLYLVENRDRFEEAYADIAFKTLYNICLNNTVTRKRRNQLMKGILKSEHMQESSNYWLNQSTSMKVLKKAVLKKQIFILKLLIRSLKVNDEIRRKLVKKK